MNYNRMSDDELRTVLGQAAQQHQPDRTAMLNRIAANRAAEPPARRPRQAIRMAGAALAVTAVLGAGAVTQWALADDDRTDTPAAPPSATASRLPSPSPSATPPTSAVSTPPDVPPARPTSKHPSTSTTTPPAAEDPGAGGTKVEQGPLWSDGSVRRSTDTAARSEITLKLGEPVTALTVTVRVKRTPGLADQGAVHDVTGARVDSQVIQEPDAFVYRFTLSSGTLAKGTHVFTARYGHEDRGRDAGGDTYRATATTAAGDNLTVYGDFY
ncbi:hypothetical protein [Actinoplanes sp. NPDC051859]|uniref:hypothetical protein n=1 Tax=Actinoplanes sp. NPDC051859 TaxID=3363909 RepID=UPI003795A7B8